MKRKLLSVTLFCLTICLGAAAQKDIRMIDSLKAKVKSCTNSTDKVFVLGELSVNLMNTDIAEADKYGQLMKEEAELSRDRKLMVRALLTQGIRYSFMPANKDFVQKSIGYLNEALELARKNKLEKESAEALLSLSGVHVSMPEPDKALRLTTQASSVISTLGDDSLSVVCLYSYGNIYQVKKERLLALQNYFNALRKAEKMPKATAAETKKRSRLLRNCYVNLRQFYADIREYDKAIDFAQKATDQLDFANDGEAVYNKAMDLFFTGNLYVAKKDYSMAEIFFNRSIELADSINYAPLKMPGYNGLLNRYISAGQPQKALEFFNNRPDLKQFIRSYGIGYVIDGAYGTIHTGLKNFDSARYYFEKAAPGYENSNANTKMNFYIQYADFFRESGNATQAAAYFSKAMEIAEQSSNLDMQRRIAKQLDSIYQKKGDYQQAYHYASLYHQFKDSLQKLGGEKDMLQMELDDEQDRQKRREAEEAEALRQKHNVQYMGITVAIAVAFLLLVMLGIFQVSETTIKVLGFFSFILLFEFIILIADNKIHHMTHGEPLPILGIKVVLIAMLLPLHHWLEHKVVSYLASRKLIIPQGRVMKYMWSKKRKEEQEKLKA